MLCLFTSSDTLLLFLDPEFVSGNVYFMLLRSEIFMVWCTRIIETMQNEIAAQSGAKKKAKR